MIWVLSVGPRPNLQVARISGITSHVPVHGTEEEDGLCGGKIGDARGTPHPHCGGCAVSSGPMHGYGKPVIERLFFLLQIVKDLKKGDNDPKRAFLLSSSLHF